jgi:DNA-binding transcriptional ArsR family regulator
MANDLLDRTFAALGDPTRRAMVERLGEGEATVGALAAPFGSALPTISKHLKVLERARLVERRVEGRRHWIRLRPEALEAAGGWLDDRRRFWDERLDSLGAVLDDEAPA